MPAPTPAEAPPFTRRQARQNARFLEALAQTGNARLAARRLGVNRSTYTKRRARNAAFAQDWDAALAAAHARFHLAGGERPPEPVIASEAKQSSPIGSPRRCAPRDDGPRDLRTRGGEPTIVRLRSGRLQLRLAPPGRMTAWAQEDFLQAYEDSANLRLAAESIGFAHPTLIARRRRSPALAAEMAEIAAAAPARIVERARREADEAFEQARRAWQADPRWPEGLTIAQALRALGAPPLKLPGTPGPPARGARTARRA
jgi:hypothetical protein